MPRILHHRLSRDLPYDARIGIHRQQGSNAKLRSANYLRFGILGIHKLLLPGSNLAHLPMQYAQFDNHRIDIVFLYLPLSFPTSRAHASRLARAA
jgi:hypothetical protein